MVITTPDQIADMMKEWPKNGSNSPAVDDENARLETMRLAEWWLNARRPAGLEASIVSEMTTGKAKQGWHFWFELRHPDHEKPCRCFRVLVQHDKPPRVYQIQFPLDIREMPHNSKNEDALRTLTDRADGWADESYLREQAENKNKKIKSIDIYRQFSDVQFTRFTNLVNRFVQDVCTILTPAAAPVATTAGKRE